MSDDNAVDGDAHDATNDTSGAPDDADPDVPDDLDVPDGLTVTLIAAVAANRVIGADGEIPWHYPADLKHFKRTTTDHPVIMGRRTYEGIVDALGEPLPERTTVVLSRSERDLPENATLANDLAAAVDAAAASAAARGVDTVYVAGGATVYEALFPVADRLVLTEIPETVAGDTRFPPVDDERWTETTREDRDSLSFVTYERS